jgi:hypothetical protein
LFDVISAQAKEAEASGFDTVLVMDHFYQLPMLGTPEQPMIECYALLSALASVGRILFGPAAGGMVSANLRGSTPPQRPGPNSPKCWSKGVNTGPPPGNR